MMNIGIFEAPYDLHDSVHFADVTEKLVAQAFARARAFDQASNVDELDCGWNNFLGARELGKHVEARIRNADHAEIRIDGAKRIVCSRRFVGPCDSVEEGRFADIRQPNNSSAQHRRGP